MDQKPSMDMPCNMICPCGGGQSCIVDRRLVGDFVHEDDVLTSVGLTVRDNCFSIPTKEQKKAMSSWISYK
jgi:hypothetical protein